MSASTNIAATPAVPAASPAWAVFMRRFTDDVSRDFLGGPRPWRLAWVWLGLFAVNMVIKEASAVAPSRLG